MYRTPVTISADEVVVHVFNPGGFSSLPRLQVTFGLPGYDSKHDLTIKAAMKLRDELVLMLSVASDRVSETG